MDLSAAIYVSSHLYAALLRFRNKHNAVQVQVDQLCIDQGLTQGKNAQVARMAEIYESVLRTVVWLGPCNREDEDLLSSLLPKLEYPLFCFTRQRC